MVVPEVATGQQGAQGRGCIEVSCSECVDDQQRKHNSLKRSGACCKKHNWAHPFAMKAGPYCSNRRLASHSITFPSMVLAVGARHQQRGSGRGRGNGAVLRATPCAKANLQLVNQPYCTMLS
jgi:hypothetical protein